MIPTIAEGVDLAPIVIKIKPKPTLIRPAIRRAIVLFPEPDSPTKPLLQKKERSNANPKPA